MQSRPAACRFQIMVLGDTPLRRSVYRSAVAFSKQKGYVMAHISDGRGPYPDKAGEFCGNHRLGNDPPRQLHESFEEAWERQDAFLVRMRFGKPSLCKAGTSAEMKAKGLVGLYLKEDRELFSWETPIETDALTEQQVSTVGVTYGNVAIAGEGEPV